ncbi:MULTISPECIES: SgcJ/EcaC family oxidoreductase [Kitasatospora]|uniref:SgcJ/EcaC family oxidoreductase n=1 Tax=Kitasatospora cathayae TaxID=3004092 RepID=A0ABY7QE64_9ACTN|nr:SgcJ/EcaC family oxidoreductase [Kitasatospora sp. HUAS 3-15]WBP90836.1 SgcJ/EcaC family oxidoreductase [Kitasatospora sp. HUAS 3-15]
MTATSKDTVEEFLERIRCAWDAGDATGYAAQFAENASYVIFMGDAVFGRAAIEQTHHEVFTRWQKGTRMAVKPIDVRMPDESTAVVITVGGIGKGGRIDFDKFQTFTLHRREGRWECVAFQNTEMSRRSKRAYRA